MYAVSGQSVGVNQKKSKKKAPRNAFSFYLDDAMIELQRSGKKVSSKAEAVPLVCDKWKQMSANEKAPYELKAKQWKMVNRSQVRPGRLDCMGQSIDNRVDMDAQNDQLRKEKRKIIRSSWPLGSEVCNEHFYIISFQSLFELPDEEGYQPCEVACIDYTLKDGILNVWHQFINPGPIKLGLKGEVKIFSERTHQIPASNFSEARKDYDFLWHQLLKFVKPNAREQLYPPIYTRTSEMKKTRFCLEWLSAKAGIANRLCNVCEFEDIAAELFVHAGKMRPSVTGIIDRCKSSMFDFSSNTRCDFHDKLECVHCTVLTVKKCCYWMSESFQQIYGYEITDNHLPVEAPPAYKITYPEQVFVDEKKPWIKTDRKRNGYNLFSSSSTVQSNDDLESLTSQSTVSDNSQFVARDVRYKPQNNMVQSEQAVFNGANKDEKNDDTSSEHSQSTDSTLTNDSPVVIEDDNNWCRNYQSSSSSISSSSQVRRPTIPSRLTARYPRTLAANFNINLAENRQPTLLDSDFPPLSANPVTHGHSSSNNSTYASSITSGVSNLDVGRGRGLNRYLRKY